MNKKKTTTGKIFFKYDIMDYEHGMDRFLNFYN